MHSISFESHHQSWFVLRLPSLKYRSTFSDIILAQFKHFIAWKTCKYSSVALYPLHQFYLKCNDFLHLSVPVYACFCAAWRLKCFSLAHLSENTYLCSTNQNFSKTFLPNFYKASQRMTWSYSILRPSINDEFLKSDIP